MKAMFICFAAFIVCSLGGCSSATVTTVTNFHKLGNPIALEATRNFQPPGVMSRPEYTIYEGSKWDCNYETEQGDYVCCTREPFSAMSPWKYCLIVDNEYRPFGFFELGSAAHTNWPGERYNVFRKIEN